MSEFLSLEYIVSNLLWIAVTPLIIEIAFAFKAPFLAMHLLRRNRPLGADIYRELAMADRFMDIWNAPMPLLSDDEPYFRAFIWNGNRQAGHNSKIDQKLESLKLIERFEAKDSADYLKTYSRPLKGKLMLRNWLVYLMLLHLRVHFLGDKFSHIASGNGILPQRTLVRLYRETSVLVVGIFVLLILIFSRIY